MDLVIMAAGKASRFGGNKQFTSVCADKSVMDYSVGDAFRCGFTRIILIIARDSENYVRQKYNTLVEQNKLIWLIQHTQHLPSAYAELGQSRQKPWGTGHIIWMLSQFKELSSVFGLINADDLYGRQAFAAASEIIRDYHGQQGMIAYFLGNTLSENGDVSRGCCQTEETVLNGLPTHVLKNIREYKKLYRVNKGTVADRNTGDILSEDVLVSMNFWILRKDCLTEADKLFREFLNRYRDKQNETEEFLLPDYIKHLLKSGLPIIVKRNPGIYYGLTYKEDLEVMRMYLSSNNIP